MIPPAEVVVVGGGHAGIEAALASVRVGCTTLLITSATGRIGEMSCNPAIGGIAKGTLVREIDALGGAMARAADATRLQFRMLNTRKGPAVWGPRVQSDAIRYAEAQREQLLDGGVIVLEDEVLSLEGHTEEITGVVCRRSGTVPCRAVVLAAGTFLGGILYRGDERWRGGRSGDTSAEMLDRDLRRRMFHVERFKTGTPPRVVRRTVDLDMLAEQGSGRGDFSFGFHEPRLSTTKERFLQTTTTDRTRGIALDYVSHSPLLTGRISGKGPRYCPSFEDKVMKFPERFNHNIYVEPMGYRSRLLYLNGLSTSLPREAQDEMVRSLPGFANSRIAEYGYAVEYTSFHHSELSPELRLRRSSNVFAAGQICGTSGYEEAAALGLLAGANAARTVKGLTCANADRMDSYLGVMTQDITSGSSAEPYRLFSSRAENRLHIRQDNADRRMLPLAREMGVLSAEGLQRAASRKERAESIRGELMNARIEGVPAAQVCRRPGTTADRVMEEIPGLLEEDRDLVGSVMLDLRYDGYIERGMRRMESRLRASGVSLAGVSSYMEMNGLCWEAREALERTRPMTVAEAERVPGVRPSDIEGLLLHVSSGRFTWNNGAGMADGGK